MSGIRGWFSSPSKSSYFNPSSRQMYSLHTSDSPQEWGSSLNTTGKDWLSSPDSLGDNSDNESTNSGVYNGVTKLIPSFFGDSSEGDNMGGVVGSSRVPHQIFHESGADDVLDSLPNFAHLRLPRRRFLRGYCAQGCVLMLTIIWWYMSSLTLTAANKVILDRLSFPYPLLLTFCHFFLTSLLLLAGFKFIASFPPLPSVNLRVYFYFILPISALTVGDIALTNLAYTMVPVSGITLIRSSVAFFTYILSISFGIEKFSCTLFSTLVFAVVSISLCVPLMETTSVLGPLVLTLSVIMSALRWVVVHTQLHKFQLLPLQLMLLTQPGACILIGIPALATDVRSLLERSESPDFQLSSWILPLVIISILLAFSLIYSEYSIIRITSSVSLCVAGLGKEIAVIIMSVKGFDESLKPRIILGIVCSIVGIFMYSWLRYRMQLQHQKLKENELEEV